MIATLSVVVAACSAGSESISSSSSSVSTTSSVPITTEARPPVVMCTEPLPGEVYLSDTTGLTNPAEDRSNWPTDDSYAPFDDRDGPATDYAPCFVAAGDADYSDNTVVIGVLIDGEARAYARAQLIAHLVNDHIGDTPLLVAY